MKHKSQWLTAGMLVVSMQLAGCERQSAEAHPAEHPVEVVKVAGQSNRVTMTAKAIERIDLKTETVREQEVSRAPSPRRVVPHSSLIYDPKGQTWVYTSPQPRTFIKHKVDVAYVEGNLAVLNDGPPAGTVVVSTAATEVYGADTGVGH
jgi:streptogramin lyase